MTPIIPWKKKKISNYYAVDLMKPIFEKGKLVYTLPGLDEIRLYCAQQLSRLWDEVKRFENPHNYYVDLSRKLWDVKEELLTQGKDGLEQNK